MNNIYQSTIQNTVSCYGITLHSGENVQMILKPAKTGTGIVFVRSDISSQENFVQATWNNVISTKMSTSISNNKVEVGTIEHLMAAIYSYKIDNLIIELDGSEVPIMDGSSRPFIFLLEYAGIKTLPKLKKYIKLLKTVSVTTSKCSITAEPAQCLSIDFTINFNHQCIGEQSISFKNIDSFKEEISPARTFGFIKDLEDLKKSGLAKGASLVNAVGLGEKEILNPEGLRFADEFVRHKLLDTIGDISLADGRLIAKITACKSGHELNNELLHKIFTDNTSYTYLSGEEVQSELIYRN